MSNEDLKFRDECAIQVMQTLLSGAKFSHYTTTIQKAFETLAPERINIHTECDQEEGLKIIRRIAKISYIIADEMRKARIKAFE